METIVSDGCVGKGCTNNFHHRWGETECDLTNFLSSGNSIFSRMAITFSDLVPLTIATNVPRPVPPSLLVTMVQSSPQLNEVSSMARLAPI